MIRTVIKLVIAALVLNALYHLGGAYWEHYQFVDSVEQLAQFSEQARPDDVKSKVMELATAKAIPMAPDDLTVLRSPRHFEIDGIYFRDITLFPTYTPHWEFKLHVSVITLN